MITITDDYVERVVTVYRDDGQDLSEYEASVIADGYVENDWCDWDTERVSCDKVIVRFRL